MVEVASATAIAAVQAQVRQQAEEQFERRTAVENNIQKAQDNQNTQTLQAVKPVAASLLSKETAEEVFANDIVSPKDIEAERIQDKAIFERAEKQSQISDEVGQSRTEAIQRQISAAEEFFQNTTEEKGIQVAEIIAAIPKVEQIARESLESSQKIVEQSEQSFLEKSLDSDRIIALIRANEAFNASLNLATDNASNEPAGADIIEAATEVFEGVDVSA